MSAGKPLLGGLQTLTKRIVAYRVVLWILVGGALGGSVRLLFEAQPESTWTHYVGHPVSGALAAYVFIILIANTDLVDLKRVVALALVAGVSHIFVWDAVARQFVDGSVEISLSETGTADPLSETKDRIDEKPSEEPISAQPPTVDDSPTTAEQLAEPASPLPRLRYLDSASRQLALGDTTRGEFSEFADQWYRIDLRQEGSDIYTIATFGSESGIDADTEVALFDSGLRELGSDDDCGAFAFSLLTLPLGPGEYVLGVSSFGQRPGGYRVVVLKGEAAIANCRPGPADYLRSPTFVDALSAPPDWASADTLRVDESIDRSFEPHVYRLAVDDPGSYTISTNGDDTGADTVVELFADDGVTLLGLDDDGGRLLYSELRRYLDSGVYFIRVSRLGRGETYTLSVVVQ